MGSRQHISVCLTQHSIHIKIQCISPILFTTRIYGSTFLLWFHQMNSFKSPYEMLITIHGSAITLLWIFPLSSNLLIHLSSHCLIPSRRYSRDLILYTATTMWVFCSFLHDPPRVMNSTSIY